MSDKRVRLRAGRGTMAPYGPPAEPDKVKWEMSVEFGRPLASENPAHERIVGAVADGYFWAHFPVGQADVPGFSVRYLDSCVVLNKPEVAQRTDR